jgi:hypothetical protein
MQTKIKSDDMPSLVALAHDAGVDLQAIPFRLAADGTLTVSDLAAEKVDAILQQPDWPKRGHRRALIGYANTVRERRESAGITVAGNRIPTDPARRVVLLVMSLGSGREIRFRTADGWLKFDGDTLRATQAAVIDFIQRCYAAQESIEHMIEHGQINSTEQVDAAFDDELG